MKKRLLSLLLSLSLIINILPMSTFAEKANKQKQQSNVNNFKDVNPDDWFYDSITYAVNNKIFTGTSEDTFSVNSPMTRGMYVTILGRIAKDVNQYSTKESIFSDVKSHEYYAPYVGWAMEKGIAQGFGDNKFGPDILINREQMATFTVRFFDSYNITYPKDLGKEGPIDLENISDYARSSVLKLWNSGLLEGDQHGNFNPKKNATRAEAATFAVRLDKITLNKEVIPPIIDPTLLIPPVKNTNTGSTKYYNVIYHSNGGSEIESQRFVSGSSLLKLPTPYKENVIFAGWYYDTKLKDRALSKDVVRKDTNLYAKYSPVAPLSEAETPSFGSALDQGTDFEIIIVSNVAMTADQVRESIDLKNLSSSEESRIDISGDGRVFTIRGANKIKDGQYGFEEGANYSLILEDERLYFQGLDTSARKFNFNIAKEDVFNLTLNQDMIYIPFDKVSNITEAGKRVDNITAPLVKISDNSDSNIADLIEGTFDYNESLKIGDTITLYKGIRPDERILDDTREGADGDIAYLEITGVNGNTYSFKNAEMEDVLFRPDVLPVSNLSDNDGDATNYSISVYETVMEFSDDIYANMQLDSQTSVDIGDYIAFYNGEFGPYADVVEYGLIESIERQDGVLVISYSTTSMDEILAAMDMYNNDKVDGETLLEGVDKEALEANIEQQARDSGFADEAAMYLSALALETDSFTELSDDFNMTDFKLKFQDGEPINPEEIRLMADGSKVEVEVSKLQATISTNLKHFDAKGVRLTLDVGIEITISVNDDTAIVIEVTGSFEEEVHIGINIDGGAKWKVWGIFPYIADYEATVSVDLYNFTGVGINATITTREKEDNVWTENKELQNISEELKKLLDAKDKYIGDGEGTVADGLNEKYKAMLENESDWVTLFEKDIFSAEIKVPPSLGILVIEISGKFKVSANMNISIGCDFYYENAKRYVYNVQVLKKNVTTDVIDIREEHYEFSFYVMGTMGLRAGVEIGIAIGIISTKLGSVGVTAEVGVYTRVWGYFYYQLKYTASQGKSSSYSGALLFELGIYLEVVFEAQAFKGTFSHEIELYAEEWPLWSAGMQENIQDFAYEEEGEFVLKKSIRQLSIPDLLFSMTYMDLKTGDVLDKVYDDGDYFKIELVNEAFSYDTATNRLTVTPDEGDFMEEGQMIITWGGAPLAFTSAPISRTFDLYWDNLNNGYTIVFNSNGGSLIPMILARFNAPILEAENPSKQGYIFDGWYTDEDLTTKYIMPELMPNIDIVVHAKWIPREDTEYKVEHYKQNSNNTLYTLVEEDTQVLQGTTDALVKAKTKSYAGFTSPEEGQVKILPDGSAIIRYYYPRASYKLIFDPGDAGGDPTVYKHRYGSSILAPGMNMAGFTFVKWDPLLPETMPSGDLTLTAQWTEASDTKYRLEHYIQNTSGSGYNLSEIKGKIGVTNAEVNLDHAKISLEGISFEKGTVDGEETENPRIKGDGSLVLKLYYTRNENTITYITGKDKTIEKTYRYDEQILPPIDPVKDGYSFDGWKSDVDLTKEFKLEKMPNKDLTVYADLKANKDTPYRVDHYQENTSGVYALVASEELSGTTDTNTQAQAKTYTGFTAKDFDQANIQGDGKSVLKIEYKRNTYQVNLDASGGNIKSGDLTEYTYGLDTQLPTNITRAGYSFEGWFTGDEKVASISSSETGDKEYIAKWSPKEDTVYRVNHLREDLEGKYIISEIETKYSKTDIETDAKVKNYAGFTDKSFSQENISGDGTTVVEILYSRNTYKLKWDLIKGILPGDYSKGDIKFGESIDQPNMDVDGYNFSGWFSDRSLQNSFVVPASMPAQDLDIYGSLEAKSGVEYKIIHYRENADDNGYTSYKTELLTGDTDQTVTASQESYDYFIFDKNSSGSVLSGHIKADGSLVLKLYYDRERFKLDYIVDEEVYGMEKSYKYGQTINHPENPSTPPEGYFFSGWELDGQAFGGNMPGKDISLRAGWSAGKKPYTIRHYQESLDNTWDWIEEDNITKEGTFDETIIVEPKKNYRGFKTPDKQEVLLNSNLSTVDFYYDRNTYMLEWIFNEGIASNDYTRDQVKFKKDIIKPILKKDGNDYEWDRDIEETMPDKDLKYEALWTANSYDVSFNESHMGTRQVTYGEAYGELPSPSKLGHTFDGWFTDAGYNKEIKANTRLAIPRDHTLYAKWLANKYSLVWNFDGGQADGYYSYGDLDYGSFITVPAVSKRGYDFSGWNPQVSNDTMPAEKLEYTATWTAKIYSVSLNANNGTINSGLIINYTYGVGALLPTDVSRKGYSFEGWYDGDLKVTQISETDIENKAYTAKWSGNTYNITYHNMEGAENHVSNVSTYKFEQGLFLGDPSKTGHKFEGWYKDASFSNKITLITASDIDDKDLYAKWTAETYNVSLNTDGGNLAEVNDIKTYTYGELVRLPSADMISKNGYIFEGWIDGSKVVTEIPLGSSGVKAFRATWSIVTYKISYEVNGGVNSSDNPSEYNVESSINLAEPTKTGYTFGGWYTDSSFANQAGIPAISPGRVDNIKFYAKWSPITYSLQFIGNEGIGSMDPQTLEYGESKELSENAFTRYGYNFVGWSKSASGNKDYDNKARVSNLTVSNKATINLYALWTPIVYSISYNLNGGTIDNNLNPKNYTVETPGRILKDPTRDNYMFKGWFDNSAFTGKGVTQIGAGAIENLNLYAKWEEKKDLTGINTGTQTFTYTYDDEAKNFLIKGTPLTGFTVKYKKVGETNWTDKAIHAGTYSVEITREQDDVYKAYRLEISNALVINKVRREILPPIGGTASYSRILVSPVTWLYGEDHGDIEYAVSKTKTAPTSGWTTSLSIGNLEPGFHYLFARILEGGDFLASTSEASTAVVAVGKMPEDWTSDIHIRTGTSSGAGTDANVGVRFQYKDTGYTKRYILDRPGHSNFENGYYDNYPVSGLKAPWRLEGVEIGNDGKGSGSNWQCASMEFNLYKATEAWPTKLLKIDVNEWFNNRYLTYRPWPNMFRRNITSVGQFASWSGSYKVTSSDTGTITKSFDGKITDQYGTYDSYGQMDAPIMSVKTSPGYTDCYSYNGKSFTIDKAKLYNKMLANRVTTITFKIDLEFAYSNQYDGENKVFTETIIITK